MLNLVMADGAKVVLKLRLHFCLVEITGSHMAKTHTSTKLSITIIHIVAIKHGFNKLVFLFSSSCVALHNIIIT